MPATAAAIIGGPGRLGPQVFTGGAAPTVDNDVDLGVRRGDLFIDTTAAKAYLCINNANGAAVWLDVSAAGAIANGVYSIYVNENGALTDGNWTIEGNSVFSGEAATAQHANLADVATSADTATTAMNLSGAPQTVPLTNPTVQDVITALVNLGVLQQQD